MKIKSISMIENNKPKARQQVNHSTQQYAIPHLLQWNSSNFNYRGILTDGVMKPEGWHWWEVSADNHLNKFKKKKTREKSKGENTPPPPPSPPNSTWGPCCGVKNKTTEQMWEGALQWGKHKSLGQSCKPSWSNHKVRHKLQAIRD